MRKSYKIISVVLALMVFPLTFTLAQDTKQLSAEAMEDVMAVEDWAIATAIENRSPQKTAQGFPSTVEKLYCFTKVVGAHTETSIIHIWYYQDTKMAEVTLPVKSLYWRTWSSKKIMPDWQGPWRVEVTSEDGNLLKTIPFTIE